MCLCQVLVIPYDHIANTYGNIMKNKQHLVNPSNVLLLILFQTNSSKVSPKCLKRNDCQSEYWSANSTH